MILSITHLFLVSLATITPNVFAKFLVEADAPEYELTHPFALIISLITLVYFYLLFGAIQSFSYQSQSAYIVFSLALATTAQTDSQTLLISRWTSVFLVPVALFYANMGFLTITPLLSICGALLGLLVLSFTAKIAKYLTQQESLGQGDIDLLACIGSFLGPVGCWMTLLFGSILGSSIGIFFFILKGKNARSLKLPFGTFLAIGAMSQLLLQFYNLTFFTF